MYMYIYIFAYVMRISCVYATCILSIICICTAFGSFFEALRGGVVKDIGYRYIVSGRLNLFGPIYLLFIALYAFFDVSGACGSNMLIFLCL